MNKKSIAVLLPCFNEEATIFQVVQSFLTQLPEAQVFVYDNNSTDNTSKEAIRAGAIVRKELTQGKASVVRSMFRDIDAEVYIMCDGDLTYPANQANELIAPIISGEADLVVGNRFGKGDYQEENKRNFHQFGNVLVKNLVNRLFSAKLSDIMSGYRAFNKRFVKSYPVSCNGFELETEMTVFALSNKLRIQEINIAYIDRPEGSESKLNTFSDGRKVLLTIFNLYRHYKPFLFFGYLGLIMGLISSIIGIPVIYEYIEFQFIYKVPSAILASGVALMAVLSWAIGLILDTQVSNHQKLMELQIRKFKHNA